MKTALILLAVISGAVLPIQAALNGKMGRAVGDPVYAALISFIVGSIGLLGYVVISKTALFLNHRSQAPAPKRMDGWHSGCFLCCMCDHSGSKTRSGFDLCFDCDRADGRIAVDGPFWFNWHPGERDQPFQGTRHIADYCWGGFDSQQLGHEVVSADSVCCWGSFNSRPRAGV